MNDATLDHLIARNSLQHVAGDIHSLLKEAIHLVVEPLDSNNLSPGLSRLGGIPDVPPDWPWPVWNAKPLAFVGQIRLADVVQFPPAQHLPSTGLLSFFYDSTQSTYGASAEDKGGWQVVYFTAQQNCIPKQFPQSLPEDARYRTGGLSFHSEWTLPTSPQQIAPNLQWDAQQQAGYEKLFQAFNQAMNSSPFHHQMFGWPDQIQDDMQLQAAMLAAGENSIQDAHMQSVEQRKGDWELLLQVDTDERLGMRWASAGMLYYWMTDQALESNRFDQSWLVLQSD